MHHIADVVKDVANRAGITEKQASKIVKNEAEIYNVDISNERAKKRRVTQDVPAIADENGEHIPLDQLVPNEQTLKAIKEMKPGVKMAVPASLGDDRAKQMENSTGVRRMIYKNEDGSYGMYYVYKNSLGRWQNQGAAAVALKSPRQSDVIKDIASDEVLNKEARRTKREGRGAQYIWTEAPNGLSTELLTEHGSQHVESNTARKANYRPAHTLVQYDPDNHHIEGGTVVDSKSGKILGNYIEIGNNGDVEGKVAVCGIIVSPPELRNQPVKSFVIDH